MVNAILSFLESIFNINLVRAFLIIIGFIILSKLAGILFEKIMHRFASRTKTILDDEVIGALEKPIKWLFIFIGFFSAAKYINFLDPYNSYVNIFFFITGVFLAVFSITKIISAFFHWYVLEHSLKVNSKKINEHYASSFKRAINIIIYLIAFIVILKHFNVEISPLLTSLGIGGLAIALALQDTLSNFFSGFYMTGDKTVSVGDYIEITPELKGYVNDVSWRTTKIRTLSGNMITIPNLKLSQSVLTNYHTEKPEMSLVIPIGVSYNSDLDEVEKITIEVATKVQEEVEGAVKDFKPFVRYKEFGESNIHFSVILKVEEYTKQYLVKHEFIKRLKKEYDKNKIEIAYPTRKIVQEGIK